MSITEVERTGTKRPFFRYWLPRLIWGIALVNVLGIWLAPVEGFEGGMRMMAKTAFGVQVGRRALEHGLLCRFDPHWIALGPPLVVTAEHVDEMVAILDRSLADVLAVVQ